MFRTEHWARRLGPKRTLPLTAMLLTVTMLGSLGAAAAVHPEATLGLLQHPTQVQAALSDGSVPWFEALYTGLITTDACFLCEVGGCLSPGRDTSFWSRGSSPAFLGLALSGARQPGLGVRLLHCWT